MEYQLKSSIEHLLVLGAGASVDYGLPIWDKLIKLIEDKVNSGEEKYLKYQKEILSWVNKVGQGKKYDTIDRCITSESRSKEYRSNGLTIENHIFSVMKDIFKELYTENDDGWINMLNQKILDSDKLEHEIAFINYNYDYVLDKNILYSEYLTEKERKVDYRERILGLSDHHIPVFYPHGNFFSHGELGEDYHSYRSLRTKKTDLDDVVDAVSCYESEHHSINRNGYKSFRLYILGLGGGLKVNLSNIEFKNKVSEIHVTVKDENKKSEILSFLAERFNIPILEIKVYGTCEELIEKCFND